MTWNSRRAIANLSGARRRGRAKTGCPVVRMECATLDDTLRSVVVGEQIDGNLAKIVAKSASALGAAGDGRTALTMRSDPTVAMFVSGSESLRERRFNDKLKCVKKSKPMMGCGTSAMIKIHWKTRLKPKSTFSTRVPNVRILDLLAACNSRELGELRSKADGGMTLTCAPVSIRKLVLLTLSLMKRRRQGEGLPASAVAPTCWHESFPDA